MARIAPQSLRKGYSKESEKAGRRPRFDQIWPLSLFIAVPSLDSDEFHETPLRELLRIYLPPECMDLASQFLIAVPCQFLSNSLLYTGQAERDGEDADQKGLVGAEAYRRP